MSRQHGYTILEVAIAMAIIAIALVPASKVWIQSARATAEADRLARATNLAQRTLEDDVRVVSFDAQVAMSGIDPSTGLQFALTLASASLPGANSLRIARVVVTLPGDSTPLADLATLTARETP